MNVTRRSFLVGSAVFIAAPAIIRVADLMPVKAWADDKGPWYTLEAPKDWKPEIGGFTATFDPHRPGSDGVWKIREHDKRGLCIGIYSHANPHALAQAYNMDWVIDRPGTITAYKFDSIWIPGT